MDLLRRWRSAGSARRAGVTALATLALAAGLAVLLAVRFHLDATPLVVVPILFLVPGLYLSWAALPGGTKVLARGRRPRRWDAVEELGVHPVIGGGPMPTYIRRPHDELLRAALDPKVTASRLVAVRGGSSTGKTRAAYEAVKDRLPGWRLDYPLDAGALAARLEAGIPARTVLWLGELRDYTDGGAAVLGRLADLLEGKGHVVITTLWPEHWTTYTDAARAGPGPAVPAGAAGRLLERLPELTGGDPARIDPARGGVIDVDDRFTAEDLQKAARTGDPALASAAAAAARDGKAGQVTQYLAGVPDLLDRWRKPSKHPDGPYGQAIITGAMDAARLGHASLLPAGLVQEAAVGYLTAPQRTKDINTWRKKALDWAAEELNGAVRALRPVPPQSGTGVAGYEVADYLDQEGRRTRQDQLGPASLWDALIAYAATAGDMLRLGQAAQARGLYRHAADLWTRATNLGSADGARRLIGHLHAVSAADTTRAAQWAVGQVSLDDPSAVGELVNELRRAGAGDAVHALLARDPAGQASLDELWPVAYLLWALHQAGAGDAVHALATRAAGQVSPDEPFGVSSLLEYLHAAGAGDAVHALATRAVGQVSPDDPQAISYLLGALRTAGAGDAVHALLARDPAGKASLDDLWAVAGLLHELRAAGADDALHALADRAAGKARLDDPGAIAALLSALHRAGAGDAVHALATRAADQVSLDDSGAAAGLLNVLSWVGAGDAVHALATRAVGEAGLDNPQPQAIPNLLGALGGVPGAGEAVHALATRAASQVSLDNSLAVALLLQALHAAGAGDAVHALLARDPARYVSLDDPMGVASLLRWLCELGAADQVAVLLARDPAGQVSLDGPFGVAVLLGALRELGAADQVAVLLARDPAGQVSLGHPPRDFGGLLQELIQAGDKDAADVLAARAANAGMFDLFLEVHPELAPSYRFGREPDGTLVKPWRWQEPPGETADA